jgi:hypothetical protein
MAPMSPPGGRKRLRLAVKLAIVLGVLVAVGALFMHTVRESRAQPYTLRREHLSGWTLALDPAAGPTGALLAIQVPEALAREVFNQIFKRVMESMRSPARIEVPLLLAGELQGALVGGPTPEAVLALARDAGVGSEAFHPRCVGYRRVDTPHGFHQVYFVLFEAPAFTRFRQRLGALAASAGGAAGGPGYDPGALSPVLIVGTDDTTFSRWLPLRADPAKDCVAPIAVR